MSETMTVHGVHVSARDMAPDWLPDGPVLMLTGSVDAVRTGMMEGPVCVVSAASLATLRERLAACEGDLAMLRGAYRVDIAAMQAERDAARAELGSVQEERDHWRQEHRDAMAEAGAKLREALDKLVQVMAVSDLQEAETEALLAQLSAALARAERAEQGLGAVRVALKACQAVVARERRRCDLVVDSKFEHDHQALRELTAAMEALQAAHDAALGDRARGDGT